MSEQTPENNSVSKDEQVAEQQSASPVKAATSADASIVDINTDEEQETDSECIDDTADETPASEEEIEAATSTEATQSTVEFTDESGTTHYSTRVA